MRKDADKYQLIEGDLSAAGLRFALIVSRFNSFITDRLLAGAVDALERMGATSDSIDVIKVPGSLEIPVVAHELGENGDYDAIICLGAVIRGDTPHFDYVSAESAKGIASASIETGIPTIYGVLTCNTLEQAIDRAGAKGGNKGFDAAMTAIEMASLMKDLRKSSEGEE
jgi:6,7-dimethyl-8-ribityllumazine synthase